jgi:hypothetical protein
MGESPNTPDESRQRHILSDEDPHYHDEDDMAPPDEDGEYRPSVRPPARGKSPRRPPPPPRRYYED